ncbi:MAG TPA: histidinol-phosphatase [Azospirillaceae bacterium]|nr:histidinol-phosphatase [Azospirillaceae bacterium]
MTDTCPIHLVALAERLADASASVIRRYYRAPLAVDDKADRTPVTQADREAERIIRTILESERPNDGIQGEEYGVKNGDAEYLWVIDPIDGTKSFVTGRPLFGTLIALVHRDRPILGIIDQPVIADRWIGAAGRPTTLNRNTVQARPCPGLPMATLGATTPEMFKGADWDAFRTLSSRCRMTVWGGDCYSYGLLAAGFYDLVVEADMKFHDYAALVPVVTGAGGVMTDWRGAPLGPHSDGSVIAASDPRTHAEALALLSGT